MFHLAFKMMKANDNLVYTWKCTHTPRERKKFSVSNFPFIKDLTENHNLTKTIDKISKMLLTCVDLSPSGFVFQCNILSILNELAFCTRHASPLLFLFTLRDD